ncbi:hypothetical protein, partial [Enterococcus cecorum]|uniref:hypothetical protein n=2 Tax=Enterococcus cecorum TaxID=44008 RepID=UPI001FAC2B05
MFKSEKEKRYKYGLRKKRGGGGAASYIIGAMLFVAMGMAVAPQDVHALDTSGGISSMEFKSTVRSDAGFAYVGISNVEFKGNRLYFDLTKVTNKEYNNTPNRSGYFAFRVNPELMPHIKQFRSSFFSEGYWGGNNDPITDKDSGYVRVGQRISGDDAYYFKMVNKNADPDKKWNNYGWDKTDPNQGLFLNEHEDAVSVRMFIEFDQDVQQLLDQNPDNYLELTTYGPYGNIMQNGRIRTELSTKEKTNNPSPLKTVSNTDHFEGDADMQTFYDPRYNAIVIDIAYKPKTASYNHENQMVNLLMTDPRLQKMVDRVEVFREGLKNNNWYGKELEDERADNAAVFSTDSVASNRENPGENEPVSSMVKNPLIVKAREEANRNVSQIAKESRWMDFNDRFGVDRAVFKFDDGQGPNTNLQYSYFQLDSGNTQPGTIVLYLKDNPANLLVNSDGSRSESKLVKFEDMFAMPKGTDDFEYMDHTLSSSYLIIKDSDGDGLMDEMEQFIGSNPYNKDTDGDGKDDGAEFTSINRVNAGYTSKATSYGKQNYKFFGTPVNTAPPVWDNSSIQPGDREITINTSKMHNRVLDVVLKKKDGREVVITSGTQNKESAGILITNENSRKVAIPNSETLEKGDKVYLRLWQDGSDSDGTRPFSLPEISTERTIGESSAPKVDAIYNTESKMTGMVPAGTKTEDFKVSLTYGNNKDQKFDIPKEAITIDSTKVGEDGATTEDAKFTVDWSKVPNIPAELLDADGHVKKDTPVTFSAAQNGIDPAEVTVNMLQGPVIEPVYTNSKQIKVQAPEGTNSVKLTVNGKELVAVPNPENPTEFVANVPDGFTLNENDEIVATAVVNGKELEPVKSNVLTETAATKAPSIKQEDKNLIVGNIDPNANNEDRDAMIIHAKDAAGKDVAYTYEKLGDAWVPTNDAAKELTTKVNEDGTVTLTPSDALQKTLVGQTIYVEVKDKNQTKAIPKSDTLIYRDVPYVFGTPKVKDRAEVPANTKAVTVNAPFKIKEAAKADGLDLTVNPDGTVTGKPEISDWQENEPERTINIPVTIVDDKGAEKVIQVPITVQKQVQTDVKVENGLKGIDGHPINDGTKAITTAPGATITPTPTNGLSVDGNGNLVGTPKVDDWKATEEERVVNIPVTVQEDGKEAKTVEVPVTIQRDTDGDGTPDVTDTDDDNDGVSDTEEVSKGSDPKDKNSTPKQEPTEVTIENGLRGIDGHPINDGTKAITTAPGATITPTPTNGLSVDGNGNLVGTPKVDDWKATEEERVVNIPVTVQEDGKEAKTVEVPVTIQRDTDGDGTPDVTDTDDDNDGVSDTEEVSKGSDPKDKNSTPKQEPTEVTIENGLRGIDGHPINDGTKAITTATGATITPTPTNGLSVDGNGNLVGTPKVDDWKAT